MFGRLLNPKNDWMFKRLFGTEEHKDLTVHLINTLLEGTQSPVIDVTFLPPMFSQKTGTLRPSIVDVLCKAEDGRQFIVEMQRAADSCFIQRLVSYTCCAYIKQRPVSEKETKDRGGYDKVHPVICLAIMEKTYFPAEVGFLSHHEFREIVTNGPYIKEMSFTFLELPKFKKNFEELETDLDRWAFFFNNAADVTPEQFDEIVNENTIFGKAYRSLAQSSYTPDELQVYIDHDYMDSEIKSTNYEAKQEGEAIGLAKGEAIGLAKGKKQIALKMLKKGMSFQEVAELTGLLEEELRTLVS